ncbi:zf-DHHC-domain-containing protein, partial [Saccharata proteae CBS 121410]
RSWARKCERYCCSVVSSFPLVVVYGLTTWAVWVQAQIGQNAKTGSKSKDPRYPLSWLGIALYCMLNWCYTTAVFTDPGSPLQSNKDGYNSLPTQEVARPYTTFTMKSDGGLRFCKKCQTPKPDRTHHCSTCGRCVLKMDHHCPWLAACIGLRNYKPFLLFLFYLALFCWVCFAVSGNWCWSEFANDNYVDNLMPVNYVILAVISGIVGLVETGFMIWHVYLACKGQTTIESLEKNRYISPLRKSMQQHLNSIGAQGAGRHYVDASARRPSISEQLLETHANVLPGVTRPEEGESPSPTPAQQSLARNQRTYRDRESQREIDRYNDYLDELDSEKLPNAFDLGWRRNLRHVLGETPYLWVLPICNSTGDGWMWEPSPKWLQKSEELAASRHAQMQRQMDRERAAGWGGGVEIDDDTPLEIRRQRLVAGAQSPRFEAPQPRWDAPASGNRNSRFLTTSNGVATVPQEGRRSPNKADQILGRAPGLYSD